MVLRQSKSGTKREVVRSESKGYQWRPASGLPFPEGWSLPCPPKAVWTHLLLESSTVCSPVPTRPLMWWVSVLIFIFEEALEVTDTGSPPSLSMSVYVLPCLLSGLQGRGRGLWWWWGATEGQWGCQIQNPWCNQVLAGDAQSSCGSYHFVGHQSPILRNQVELLPVWGGGLRKRLNCAGKSGNEEEKKAAQGQMEPHLTSNGSWQKTGPALFPAWRVFGASLTSPKLGKTKRSAGDPEFSYQIPDLSVQWWVCGTYVNPAVTRHPVTGKG